MQEESGRQMKKDIGRDGQPITIRPLGMLRDRWRGDKCKQTARERHTTSQTGRQVTEVGHHEPDWGTNKWEDIRRAPPARLGDKWIGWLGDKWIPRQGKQVKTNSRRAGHHQPDWETNEVRDTWRAGHHHLERAWHLLRKNWELQQ